MELPYCNKARLMALGLVSLAVQAVKDALKFLDELEARGREFTGEKPVAKTESEDLTEKVFSLINEHPEGVSAGELGDLLGRKPQALYRPLGMLKHQARVYQKEGSYYAV